MMPLDHSRLPQVVLVVEDEMLLRMRVVDMVEDAGYIPVEAVDADEAMAILRSRSDIVLMLTDGVLETAREDRTPFGVERTLQTVHENRDKPAAQIVESLYRAVCEFAHQDCHVDDVTAVVMKVA